MAIMYGGVSLFELLGWALFGSVLRAVFGMYKTYAEKRWVRPDWTRLIIEVLASLGFGTLAVLVMLEFGFAPFAERTVRIGVVAFVGGFFGADLVNVLARKVGVSQGMVTAMGMPVFSGLKQKHKSALEYVSNFRSITNDKYQKLNRVSHSTATRDLKWLVKRGYLKRKGAGKATRYELR